jgi:Amylo-alpha-1,6-glucosidase
MRQGALPPRPHHSGMLTSSGGPIGSRLPGPSPGPGRRAARRLPLGHSVAVADRPLHRCRPGFRGPTRPGCWTASSSTSPSSGSISETTDGDAPHAAMGCPFQAWSTAELIRSRWASTERAESMSSCCALAQMLRIGIECRSRRLHRTRIARSPASTGRHTASEGTLAHESIARGKTRRPCDDL